MRQETMSKSTNQPTLLSVEMLAELRQRVRDNVYANPDFVDAVARRLLRSGDL